MKPKLTKDFFFGGNAIFTVKNNQTGEHRTYRIKVTKPNPRFPRATTLFSQMTGTDNLRDYSYVGKIIRRDQTAAEAWDHKEHKAGTVELTGGSTWKDNEAKPVKAARWIVNRIWNDLDWPDHFEIMHAGRCGRCAKLLTNPESIERGIGPECWGIMHPEYKGE